MYLVKLATLLQTMDQFQTIQTLDIPTKVKWIDLALSDDNPDYKLPFRRKQTSLRVFDGVVVYPAPSDYDELCYVDNDAIMYSDRARFRYSSFNEFLEDKDNRNDLAEIMDGEEVFIGCRYKGSKMASVTVDSAENALLYTCSNDASSPTFDNVFFKEGSGSVRFTVTQSLDSALIENTFTPFINLLYKRNYNFRWVYLDSVPTSINMRFGNNASNYLHASVTKQFSGQSFKAQSWNFIAFDLNTANTIGTINPTTFSYEGIELIGAPTGTYYVDASYLKIWELLDNFWYYSSNRVKTLAGTYKQFFFDPVTQNYDVTDSLIGTSDFADYIAYTGCLYGAVDKNDAALITNIASIMNKVGKKIPDRFTMVKPLITNFSWRFRSNLLAGRSRQYGPNGLISDK